MKKRETCAYTGVYIYILADYCLVDLRIGSACARNNFKRVSFRNSKSDRAFFRRRRRCCCPDTHNIILFYFLVGSQSLALDFFYCATRCLFPVAFVNSNAGHLKNCGKSCMRAKCVLSLCGCCCCFIFANGKTNLFMQVLYL